jgi:Tfp pilus assembly protein PilO
MAGAKMFYATAQQSSVDQFSGDIAILKKYLKSKGIEAAVLEELDSLCEDMEKRWLAAFEPIESLLEE